MSESILLIYKLYFCIKQKEFSLCSDQTGFFFFELIDHEETVGKNP